MIRVSKSVLRPVLHPENMLWAGMVVLFMFLLLRSVGIYPVVFADEWSYSSYSRLLPLQEAGVPSYLYLTLFKVTSICGDGFLSCARTINSILIILAVPFIYAVARRLCGPWPAVVVALLSVAGPFNTYAIYFMPEVTYFVGFWLLSWAVLTKNTLSPIRLGLLYGALLGVLSLVKVHALFLLPGVACYGIYNHWRSGRNNWAASGAITVGYFGLSFVTVKLSIGYLLAGRSGVTFFGSLYSAQAGAVTQSKDYVELALNALTNLTGHVMALSLMFGLPIAVMLATRLRRSKTDAALSEFAVQDLVVYTGLVLVPLLAVVGYFTASVAGSGPYENLGRLHMRYYNFAFPLLLLVAASKLKDEGGFRRVGAMVAAMVALVAGYGLWGLLPNFSPSMVDSPELRGLTWNSLNYYLLGTVGIGVTLGWIFNARRAAQVFIFCAMPVMVATGSWYVSAEVRQRLVADAYDDAGLFAKQYLGPAASRLVVVGPEPAALLRTLFHIDNAKTTTLLRNVGSPLDFTALPADTDFLLLIGDYDLPNDAGNVISLGKYSLVSKTKNYQVDFRQSLWPGVLSRARGLSLPEAWGTWSIGREVMLEFANNLPSHFQVSIDAHAFGPNVGKDFIMSIDGEQHSFRLDSTPKTVTLNFSSGGGGRIVRITVPYPTAPRDIGVNDDSRELGIAFSQIRVYSSNSDEID